MEYSYDFPLLATVSTVENFLSLQSGRIVILVGFKPFKYAPLVIEASLEESFAYFGFLLFLGLVFNTMGLSGSVNEK